MKIAHVVCVLPPYGGGIGMVAHAYADQLQKLGHDVTAFIPKGSAKGKIKTNYKVKKLWPIFKLGNGAVLPQLFFCLWKFDIVHLHFPFFGAGIFIALLKKIKPKSTKLVITYHMDCRGVGLKKYIFNFFKNFLHPIILKTADKITVSSYDYIENSDIAEFYFENKNKFDALPFGVSKRFFPTEKDQLLLEKYNFTKDDKIVLFVGGLDSAHYFKGVDYLIKAFEKIENKNIKCLIVGKGNLKPKFEQMVKQRHLESRIKFSGYVQSEDLPKYYNLCDIFILPSINKAEAFGIVLLEAMACAKPLIASNLKGVRSVAEQSGILIEPKNSSDIAAKINYLVENPDAAILFGKNGLKTVEEKYRWPVITKELEQIYKNLIK